MNYAHGVNNALQKNRQITGRGLLRHRPMSITLIEKLARLAFTGLGLGWGSEQDGQRRRSSD